MVENWNALSLPVKIGSLADNVQRTLEIHQQFSWLLTPNRCHSIPSEFYPKRHKKQETFLENQWFFDDNLGRIFPAGTEPPTSLRSPSMSILPEPDIFLDPTPTPGNSATQRLDGVDASGRSSRYHACSACHYERWKLAGRS